MSAPRRWRLAAELSARTPASCATSGRRAWVCVAELERALAGRSLLDPERGVDHPLEALYVTGHSLGGAMATLFALALDADERSALTATLRAIYTFGQPLTIAGAPPGPVQRWLAGSSATFSCAIRSRPCRLRRGAVSSTSDANTTGPTASGGPARSRSPRPAACASSRPRSWRSSGAPSAAPPRATRSPTMLRTTTSRRSARKAGSPKLGDPG